MIKNEDAISGSCALIAAFCAERHRACTQLITAVAGGHSSWEMGLTRRTRLVVLVILGVVPPSLAIFLLNKTVTATTPPAIQAAIVGGLLTAMGTIFTAVYKEVSAYFQQTTNNVDKKVTMISPLVQKYYSPWINSAQILHGTLQRLTAKHPAEPEDVQTLLYHIMVFYGYRMRFVLEAGGLILLSSTAEQNAVHDAYRTAELALDWEDARTHRSVSYLQMLFLTKNTSGGTGEVPKPPSVAGEGLKDAPKPTGSAGDGQKDVSKPTGAVPYTFFQFSNDIPGDKNLTAMISSLADWTTKTDKVQEASDAVNQFALTFQRSIDQLYTAWGE
jgi:hypothetical protein